MGTRILATIAMSMLLLVCCALPAAASDYTLGVFGNANEDDTINMQDVTYTELIILEYRDRTELTDAKYDGRINMQDVTQIELVILGQELELTLIDSSDRIVTVPRPIERIVVFTHGVVETTRSLRLDKDKIIGLDKWTKANTVYYPEISESAVDLGSYYSPDYEKLLELQPDTVIHYSSSKFDVVVDTIKEADPTITVLRFDCWKSSTYFDEVNRLGYVLGKTEEADEFLEFYEGCLNGIIETVEEISEDERPKVYLELGDTPYSTTGNRGGWHESLDMAGGRNIFGDLSLEHFNADPEEVINCDPEIIVRKEWPEGGYDSDDMTEMIPARDEIMSRPELADVMAVKNGRVYIIATEIYANARFVVGTAHMAKWFHPELFEDLDPQAIHQEYLERFQGIPYQGVYGYPPFEES